MGFFFVQKWGTSKENKTENVTYLFINQMAVYHAALEMINNVFNSTAENIQEKIILPENPFYEMRSRSKGEVKIPKPPPKRCMGFSYTGPKLYNHLPEVLRKIADPILYKELLKNWIWEEIPSV